MYDRLSARCFMPYPEVPVPHAKEGSLTGLTFAVKDIFDVAGYPTSAGNPTFLALQPKSRSKPSRYSSENDVLIEKSVKYTDFFLLCAPGSARVIVW